MRVGKSAFHGVSRHSDVIMADKTRRRNATLIHLSFLTSSEVSFNVSYQLCQLKAGGSFFPTVPGAAAGRNRSATGALHQHSTESADLVAAAVSLLARAISCLSISSAPC